MNIFISHDSADQWVAEQLAHLLSHVNDVETFVDTQSLRAGETIEHRVKIAIRNCHHFVAILSPSSLVSQWVMWELGGADILDKPIVPVLHGIHADQIPDFLAANLAVPLNEFGRYVTQVESLTRQGVKR